MRLDLRQISQYNKELVSQWDSQRDNWGGGAFKLPVSVDLFCVIAFARNSTINVTVTSNRRQNLIHIIFCVESTAIKKYKSR
jgi:hypothetical protein